MVLFIYIVRECFDQLFSYRECFDLLSTFLGSSKFFYCRKMQGLVRIKAIVRIHYFHSLLSLLPIFNSLSNTFDGVLGLVDR